jgi:hypothetical protein
MQSLSHGSGAAIGGMIGVVAETMGMVAVRDSGRASRCGASGGCRRAEAMAAQTAARFSALLPSTKEGPLWVFVAVSAGVCEEIVFRGWLPAALQGQMGLRGMAGLRGCGHLRAVASIPTGFRRDSRCVCVPDVATGSFWVLILLHIMVDARFALLPAPRI